MNNTQLATFGGGCFWCTEAVFQRVKGILKVTSGYSGGTVPGHPTYREVCSGLTGHAEVIQLEFNPEIISYQEIIIIFMTTHDPTTLNRQGADVGTEYRSIIFYHSEEQKQIVETVFTKLTPYYPNPIITELVEYIKFYEAEKEHQDFYNNNKEYGYCTFVINPKLAKLREFYADKLKNDFV
ncbi:peptide-methionine (S)-S-oxide reductase MsrA [Pseudofulvibacter geojedonensis]|uniref:Peptide methionine sulfoxide reductase MsrA n=1 Tax=Pseudofulvibacter geojedonensis TaxID=1123758 RepID=A0ABW3I2W6_9FLAO